MQLSDIIRLPEKSWTPKKNGVQTVIKAVGQTTTQSFNNDDGSQALQYKQPVTVTDLTGRTEKITHQTQYPESLLGGASVGQAATWRLKWYRGRAGTKIVGYPTDMAPNIGAPPEPWQLPQAPQAPLQAPQLAPQSTNVQQPAPQGMRMPDTYAYEVTPKTQARMAASVALQCAVHTCGRAPEEMSDKEAAAINIEVANFYKEWILNGNEPESAVENPLEDDNQWRDED